MRDHGAQLDLDSGAGEFEGKVEAVIRELRNVLKETIVEGGKSTTCHVEKQTNEENWFRNGNVFKFGDEFDCIGTGR